MGTKKPALSKPPQRMTKKERSRWEKERRIQRTFIIVLAAVGVVSILVLAMALLYDNVWYPRGVVAEVNGEPIRRSDYWSARRMDLIADWQQMLNTIEIYQSMGITLTEDQWGNFRYDLTQILYNLGRVKEDPVDETVMQQLIAETVVLQAARELGVTVTDEEVDAFLLPGPQPQETGLPGGIEPLSPTVPVSTLTPQERNQQLTAGLTMIYNALRNYMKDAAVGAPGFTYKEYVAMVRRTGRLAVVEGKIQDHLAQSLPQYEEQAWVGHILVRDRATRADQAQQAAQQAVAQGQSLASVVVRYSDDETSRGRAGEIEIVRGAGRVSPAVEAAALALTPQDPLSPVIEDDEGIHLLQWVDGNPTAGRVVVRRILIPADRRAEAEIAWGVAKDYADSFAQIASIFSEDEATAARGGDMGWVTRGDGQLTPLVEATAFAMTLTNQVSPVIGDETGYHILQLVQRDDAASRIYLRRIVILSGRGLAAQLLADIRAGEQGFVEAVVERSTDEESLNLAGDIGWISRGSGRLPADVEAAALAMTQTNSLSPILEDASGYYLVQLLERDDAAGRVHLRLIFIQRAEALIRQIHDQIVSGDPATLEERFQALARRYSDEALSSGQGGDLGWIGRGQAATAEIEAWAFAMEPGQISEPLEGASGWHILWQRGYDQNRPIAADNLATRAQQLYQDKRTEWLAQAVVVRYPPLTPTPLPASPIVPTEAP